MTAPENTTVFHNSAFVCSCAFVCACVRVCANCAACALRFVVHRVSLSPRRQRCVAVEALAGPHFDGTMNQGSLSFSLTQISVLCANLNKKNFAQNTKQIALVSASATTPHLRELLVVGTPVLIFVKRGSLFFVAFLCVCGLCENSHRPFKTYTN